MGQRSLIDTNVIIDYTFNLFDVEGSAFVESVFNTQFDLYNMLEQGWSINKQL